MRLCNEQEIPLIYNKIKQYHVSFKFMSFIRFFKFVRSLEGSRSRTAERSPRYPQGKPHPLEVS